ncbi:MAG: DNA polymerase IV [Patescibacteria group bacterium]|jgi:DNA polymerase-4
MPIILHIDFNSFFASVEQQANPFLRGKAIAVAGKGRETIDPLPASPLERWRGHTERVDIGKLQFARSVVTTASREAKKRGVKTAMATWEARKLVPDLLIIPGDPHKYSEITARMMAILRRYGDAVEQFSADEAFADITCASGGDYFGAALLAERIRADVRAECGEWCTASLGVAPNRLVAKLASESQKPDGLTIVPPDDVLSFIDSRPLADFCGIGPRIEQRLASLGATSTKTLRELPRERLLVAFKKSYGDWLYFAARGMSDDRVVDETEDPKSVGHSYTFPQSLETENDVRRHLLGLADRVSWRMRKQGLAGTHISVYVRYDDMDSVGLGKKYKEPMFDGLTITKTALALLLPRLSLPRGIRLLGVSVSGLVKLPGANPLLRAEARNQSALRSLDKISERYGNGTWQRLSTLGVIFKERTSGWHYDHEV